MEVIILFMVVLEDGIVSPSFEKGVINGGNINCYIKNSYFSTYYRKFRLTRKIIMVGKGFYASLGKIRTC